MLAMMARRGNSLSSTLRLANDSGNLGTLTKNSPDVATNAHIVVQGQITKPELTEKIETTEIVNGFCNRLLFCCATRDRLLPHGGEVDATAFRDLVAELVRVMAFARDLGRVQMDAGAYRDWIDVYPMLTREHPGLFGALVARGDMHVTPLALAFALLGQSGVIRREHLLAGLAVWRYAEDSARFIFGDATGNPIADDILAGLRTAGSAGMTRTDISKMLNRNVSSPAIQRALDTLDAAGLAACERRQTDGRPQELWLSTERTGEPH